MMPDSSRIPDLPSSRRPRAAAPTPSLCLEVASRTDAGLERDNNEDNLLVTALGASARALPRATRLVIEPPGFALLAVCDGMGGARAGEVASRLAVDLLEEAMLQKGPAASPAELGPRLTYSLEEASRRIHQQASQRSAQSGMGTTATACALAGDTLHIAQIADSRAYLLRRGRLTQLTRDQTLATLMLESGQLAPEEVHTFAFGHVILQAVGTAERVEVDLRQITVCAGDVLLLCSDGLHGPVSDAQIQQILEREPTPAAACDALITQALDAGGPDNISCIVARIEGSALAQPTGEVQIERPAPPPEDLIPQTERPVPVTPEDPAPSSKPPSMLEKLRAFFNR